MNRRPLLYGMALIRNAIDGIFFKKQNKLLRIFGVVKSVSQKPLLS